MNETGSFNLFENGDIYAVGPLTFATITEIMSMAVIGTHPAPCLLPPTDIEEALNNFLTTRDLYLYSNEEILQELYEEEIEHELERQASEAQSKKKRRKSK